MMGISYMIVASCCSLFLYVYLKMRSLYNYWERKGVKHPKPRYFFGNALPLTIAASELYSQLYDKYSDDKFLGFYEMSSARLLLIDPDLIQRVLIKDFSHFMDRRTTLKTRSNHVINTGLFFITGPQWRVLRKNLSPAFTSGKLKVMFHRMVDCFNNLDREIESKIGQDIEARDIIFCYTVDVITSCVFGLDVSKDKTSATEFRAAALKVLWIDHLKTILLIILSNFPLLTKLLDVSLLNKSSIAHYNKVLKEALRHRRETGYSRNDFLQLLIQLEEKEQTDNLNNEKSINEDEFGDVENIALAQAFTFLAAGNEASGNTMTFVLAEFAHRQDIQDQVRKEIQDVLKSKDYKFTFQAVKDMVFLENCILETLRLYPAGKQIRRMCTKKFQLDSDVSIDVGTNIIVPASAIHRDPRYFIDPLEFNPDRFKDSIKPGTFFPFGDGPRMCIGMRFAMVEVKVCLAKLISNYRVTPGENFIYPIPLNRWSFFSVPSKPVYIRLNKIS